MHAKVLFHGHIAPDLAIIIPAFNEEQTISRVIRDWTKIAECTNGNIILINDGSKDDTLKIALSLQFDNPRLIIIDKENTGHADSCLYAYQWAVQKGFRWIFQTDSDGQTNPEEFHTFWQLKERFPLVFGYRPFREDGLFRLMVSKILMAVIFFIFKTYIKDANVPFRLMDANILSAALKRIPDKLFLGNAFLSVELNRIEKIHWKKISFYPRQGGTPSVDFPGFFKKGMRVIDEFIRIKKEGDASPEPQRPLLEYATLIYLTIPYFFFWAYFFQTAYAVIFSLLTAYGLYRALSFYRTQETFSPVDRPSNRIKLMLPVFAITFLWLFLSGAGGVSYQNIDYLKHNGMLYDLINFRWPVHYQGEDGSSYYLCYYLAYYLVPSFIGKITNITWGYTFSFLWALLGLWLAMNWILKLAHNKSVWIILVFVFFSGLDIIGTFLTKFTVLINGMPHLEWWAGYNFWQYSSNTSLLYWVPQHAIGGWLTVPLLFSLLQYKGKAPIPALFIFAITFLWSNFVLLGLVPMMMVLFYENGFRRFLHWTSVIPALGILMPVALYYLGNQYPHVHAFIWKQNATGEIFSKYLLFCLLEFGVFALFIFPYIGKLKQEHQLLIGITLMTLLLIPLYRFGAYNDLAMRTSIPSLLILQIILLRLWNFYSKPFKFALVLILLIGTITPVSEIARSYKLSDHRFNRNTSLLQIPPGIAAQYFGGDQTFYYKYLAPKGYPGVMAASEITDYLKKR